MKCAAMHIGMALTALWLSACGGLSGASADSTSKAGDRQAVLQVMKAGQKALLSGDPRIACHLATAAGRHRALVFAGDLPASSPRKTCVDVIRGERKLDQSGEGSNWTRDLRHASFKVMAVEGDSATVRLRASGPYGITAGFTLLKVHGKWRVDNSDVVPVGD